MDDLDRVLDDALKTVGSDYRPPDLAGAHEEYLRRRRRQRMLYVAGGTALAGASLLLGLLVMGRGGGPLHDEKPPAAAARLEIEAAIPVGRNPSGVALGSGSVWVANLGDGTVSRVDPDLERVVASIEVGGRPDDVVATEDGVWVTDYTNGRITPVSANTNRAGRALKVSDPRRHLDVAAAGDYLWVAVADDEIVRVDRRSRAAAGRVAETATDVSVDGDRVWFLDSHRGRAGEIDPRTLKAISRVELPQGGGGGDLAVSAGRMWITHGKGGVLYGVDAESGETVEIPLGGTYAGVAADDDSAWVVTGNSEEIGRLTRVDARSGEVVGRPLVILGVPHDVALGFDSVWVSDNAAGSLLRVSTIP